MTKISCTECRERLGELLAEEVAPVHAGQNGALSADLALLRSHLDECEECAHDLKLLRAARAALRSFPPQSAPSDLRERIRAQIEREPSPFPSNGNGGTLDGEVVTSWPDSNGIPPYKSPIPHRNRFAALPIFAKVPRVRTRHHARDVRDSWDRFSRFFRRPANVAWASGVALAVFCIVLVARPGRESGVTLYSPVANEAPSAPTAQSARDTTAAASKETAKPAAPHAKAGNKAKNASPQKGATPAPALPGAPLPVLPPFSGSDPFATPDSGDPFRLPPPVSPAIPAVEDTPAKLPQAAPQKQNKPAANSNQAPPASTPVKPAAERDRTNSQISTHNEQAAEAAGTLRSAPAGAPGPAGPASAAGATAPRQAFTPALKSASPAYAMRAQSDADTARPAPTPLTRFISARLVPSRDVSWGQISAVLSGDVSFDGDGKARVVWRGSAAAGEPIDVGFSVSGLRGQYSARLTLQEIKNGEAQAVTSSSVPINLR